MQRRVVMSLLIAGACAWAAGPLPAQAPTAPTGEKIDLPIGISEPEEAVQEAMKEAGTGDSREFLVAIDAESDITGVRAGDVYSGGDKTLFTVLSVEPNGTKGGAIRFKRSAGKSDPDMGFKFNRVQGTGAERIASRVRLIDFYYAAGWPAHFILALGIGAILMAANSLWLYRRGRQCPASLVAESNRLLDKGDVEGLEDVAAKRIGLLAHLCRALTDRFDTSTEEDIRTRAEVVAGAQITRLRVPIKLLNFFAVCAPLMGLAGTIYGMIIVFEGIAGASEASRASLLAAGIRLKLLCTLFALMVAIPSLLLYFVFNSRLSTLVAECELATERLMHKIMLIKRKQEASR
ncbi:MAG: MotA/TolQ/ExbB proton channel family protein [Thermoguttaceae bacterium]